MSTTVEGMIISEVLFDKNWKVLPSRILFFRPKVPSVPIFSQNVSSCLFGVTGLGDFGLGEAMLNTGSVT